MDDRRQRKRIPVTLAGSYLSRGGTQKPPQAPPPNPPKPKPQKPSELPNCPHSVKLSQADYDLYEKIHEGHLLMNESGEVGAWPYYAKDCPECNPTCEHGELLAPEEIKFAKEYGVKVATECPACMSSTDISDWDEFLSRIGFPKDRGASLAAHYVPTREGGVVPLGQTKNLVSVGGTQELDELDANSDISRDDLPARSTTIRMRKEE